MSFLEQIVAMRGAPSVGGQPLRWIELVGGSPIAFGSYLPDANTSHESFFYDARDNVLYQRVTAASGGCATRTDYAWKRISERR